jgi:cysteine desulfurase/selenocysteine lyase
MSAPVTLPEILDEFSELEERDEQSQYLVELGETLGPFPDQDRTEENRVLGCQSKVWVVADEVAGDPQRLRFIADSDAPMVRGLVALLLAAYSGKTPQEIVEFPIEATFEQLKLASFLSPMRSNGLHSMVKRIQAIAREAWERQRSGQGSPPPRVTTSSPALPPTMPLLSPRPAAPLDVARIRQDFPLLERTLERGRKLVYLDNAASTLRPLPVLRAMDDVERRHYSNVHRGGHTLAAETTALYEQARERVRRLLNARAPQEIIFTAGTTAAINIVARSWGDANLRPGDEIVLTKMEHHSNIVPWQQLAQRAGAVIHWVPFTDRGELELEAFDRVLGPRTKLVSFVAVSNVFGTINPVREIVAKAHAAGALALVDAAQCVPHTAVDVQTWDCDFLAFSGHKMAGPSGVGALYGKEAILEQMPPFLGGGSMIHRVTTEGFVPAGLPHRFEAGTPMIVPAIGLGAAVEYLEKIGLSAIHAHEQMLTAYAHGLLTDIPGLRVLGPEPARKGGLATFTLEGVSATQLAWQLDGRGIAVRAGHHCAMPLHDCLGLEATCRASFYFYNCPAEIEALAEGLQAAAKAGRR